MIHTFESNQSKCIAFFSVPKSSFILSTYEVCSVHGITQLAEACVSSQSYSFFLNMLVYSSHSTS